MSWMNFRSEVGGGSIQAPRGANRPPPNLVKLANHGITMHYKRSEESSSEQSYQTLQPMDPDTARTVLVEAKRFWISLS